MYSWKVCKAETKGQGFFQRLFSCGPSLLDYYWRRKDFRIHRSYGGLTSKYLKVDGHAPMALFLGVMAILFAILGPTLGWRGFEPVVIFLICCGLLYAGARWLGSSWLLWIELALLAGLSLVIWLLTSDALSPALEINHNLYRHLLVVWPLVLIPLVLIGKVVSHLLFRAMHKTSVLSRLLPHVHLFVQTPRPPAFRALRIFRSLVNVPLRHPLQLIYFVSLVVLFLPYYFHAGRWVFYALAFFWVLIAFATIHDRFNAVLPLIDRALFIGGQLVVSLIIIILAAGRLLKIGYIQTVVESSSYYIMVHYLLAAYMTFWFLEYWLNRMLCEQLIGLIQLPGDPQGRATYQLAQDSPYAQSSSVSPDERSIQIHGGARIMVIGKLKNGTDEAYQPYEKKDFFHKLIQAAEQNDTARSIVKQEKLEKIPRMISQRVRFYFSLLNVLLIGAFIGLGFWIAKLPQEPIALIPVPKESHNGEIAAGADAPESARMDLDALIWRTPGRKRVILLAASGGGSRAALYTQSVLHGLHTQKALEDLVLASGVSGGGAALAYYAAHRDTLLADENGRAWQQFSCDMSYPYIWDVLEGASEWRIVAETRLGQLLKESFDRVFYRQGERPVPPARRTIGQSEVGLILNTSLAGHLDCPTCPRGEEKFAVQVAQKVVKRHTDGSVAGGRLIFTNLEDVSGFCQDNTSANIPYIVIKDGAVDLTTAAALNANFPPVFSNAPVDVDHRHRYWVTDGGATENRGMISLLLALRASLRKAPASLSNVPDIHIVMADASAGSTKYSQDRGVGSKFGAPTKLANKLIRELLDDVIRQYAQRKGKVYYHDLSMPDFLRINGGLGTHWMLPRAVKMQIHANTSSPTEATSLELDTLTIRQVINDLHRSEPVGLDQACQIGLCPEEELAWQWSREERRAGVAKILEQLNADDNPHRKAWQQLIAAWPKAVNDSQ